jgi:hypothetical protein
MAYALKFHAVVQNKTLALPDLSAFEGKRVEVIVIAADDETSADHETVSAGGAIALDARMNRKINELCRNVLGAPEHAWEVKNARYDVEIRLRAKTAGWLQPGEAVTAYQWWPLMNDYKPISGIVETAEETAEAQLLLCLADQTTPEGFFDVLILSYVELQTVTLVDHLYLGPTPHPDLVSGNRHQVVLKSSEPSYGNLSALLQELFEATGFAP